MLMVRESKSHRLQAEAVARIGREPIAAENKENESFEKFREKKKETREDISKSLYKYTNDIGGLPV